MNQNFTNSSLSDEITISSLKQPTKNHSFPDKIAAIIVTYHPCIKSLKKLLSALGSQVDLSIIIDNGSSKKSQKEIAKFKSTNTANLLLTENKGIAVAQNLGIKWARSQQAEFVLLMDQDSIPAPDMVKQLLSAIQNESIKNTPIAAIGPNYSDIKGSHRSPFVKLINSKLHRITCQDNEIVNVDHLISSGCLISIKSLDEIGEMEEKLFIDYVDTEWCLRALNKGYSLFGVGAAKMKHSIGDDFTYIFGRNLPVHSAIRQYYIIRNGFWLMRQPWVSHNWRIMDIQRLLLIYITYSIFIGTRYKNWKMMSKGISDAISRKMGKYEP